jgi:hypothetical protein
VFSVKRKLAFLTVPAVVALGAVSYGSVVAMAAPITSPAAAASPSAPEPAESATTPETVEANEPALPGGGYADADNVQADTQQEGIN